MVCAGDPAICQTSGDAVDFSAHQPRPHDDIFQYRTGAGSGGTERFDRGLSASCRRIAEAADEMRGSGV